MWNVVKNQSGLSGAAVDPCDPHLAVSVKKKKKNQVQAAPNANNSTNETPQMFSVQSSSRPESHEPSGAKRIAVTGVFFVRVKCEI